MMSLRMMPRSLLPRPNITRGLKNAKLVNLEKEVCYREECAAFLVNNDNERNATVHFENSTYELPPESVSILPDCKIVAFNTAKVGTEYTTRSMKADQNLDSPDKWEEFNEPIPSFDKTLGRANTLLEQMSATKDKSDYLWYTFRFQHESLDTGFVLKVNSLAHVLHAFVNGKYIGSAHGCHSNLFFALEKNVSLINGTNHVSLLSVMAGLPVQCTSILPQP
ncbi:hypothetical protein ACJW31_02G097000 [Castanea mollissima]